MITMLQACGIFPKQTLRGGNAEESCVTSYFINIVVITLKIKLNFI